MEALRNFGMPDADIEAAVGARFYPAAPELWPDNAEYLAAFADLSPLRPVGFAPCAIPAAEMLAYCRLHGIGDTEEFFGRVRAADLAWLEHMRTRRDG